MNQNKPKTLESSITIRFQHCDPFGHLNNATYIDYFLNAREDQLNEYYGLHLLEYAKQNKKAWVVASHKINYLIPVKAMQVLKVRSQLQDFTSKSLTVNFALVDQEKEYCHMNTTFVFVDLNTKKPVNHTEDLMELFSEIKCEA